MIDLKQTENKNRIIAGILLLIYFILNMYNYYPLLTIISNDTLLLIPHIFAPLILSIVMFKKDNKKLLIISFILLSIGRTLAYINFNEIQNMFNTINNVLSYSRDIIYVLSPLLFILTIYLNNKNDETSKLISKLIIIIEILDLMISNIYYESSTFYTVQTIILIIAFIFTNLYINNKRQNTIEIKNNDEY